MRGAERLGAAGCVLGSPTAHQGQRCSPQQTSGKVSEDVQQLGDTPALNPEESPMNPNPYLEGSPCSSGWTGAPDRAAPGGWKDRGIQSLAPPNCGLKTCARAGSVFQALQTEILSSFNPENTPSCKLMPQPHRGPYNSNGPWRGERDGSPAALAFGSRAGHEVKNARIRRNGLGHVAHT